MKIAVVTVIYSTTASIDSLLATMAGDTHTFECHLFRHSSYPDLAAACRQHAENPAVISYAFEGNRGVSRSWNEGMLAARGRGADVTIIVNDDIVFSPGDVDRLARKAAGCRDRYIVSCAGHHRGSGRRIPSCGYACFAINPVALERLGCFDENFFPAYCEDQDYARRAVLAGLSEENCPATCVEHIGSNAIISDPALRRQNAMTHGRNLAYYQRKWGGYGDRETFSRPFNDARFDLRIAPERRARPYGAPHDRNDRDIVVM